MGKKESSDAMSKLASAAMRREDLTKTQIAKLGASVLGQDEHKGARPPSAKPKPSSSKKRK